MIVFAIGTPSSGIPHGWAAGEDRPGVHVITSLTAAAADRLCRAAEDVRRPGDVVVSEGSFSVLAERERLGLRPSPSAPGSELSTTAGHAGMSGAPDVQEAMIVVGDTSFEPSRLTLRAGVPARLTFTRTSDKTCATSVVVPSLKVKKELPLNQPVTIEFTSGQAGEIAFACGMNMLRGTIVVN